MKKIHMLHFAVVAALLTGCDQPATSSMHGWTISTEKSAMDGEVLLARREYTQGTNPDFFNVIEIRCFPGTRQLTIGLESHYELGENGDGSEFVTSTAVTIFGVTTSLVGRLRWNGQEPVGVAGIVYPARYNNVATVDLKRIAGDASFASRLPVIVALQNPGGEAVYEIPAGNPAVDRVLTACGDSVTTALAPAPAALPPSAETSETTPEATEEEAWIREANIAYEALGAPAIAGRSYYPAREELIAAGWHPVPDSTYQGDRFTELRAARVPELSTCSANGYCLSTFAKGSRRIRITSYDYDDLFNTPEGPQVQGVRLADDVAPQSTSAALAPDPATDSAAESQHPPEAVEPVVVDAAAQRRAQYANQGAVVDEDGDPLFVPEGPLVAARYPAREQRSGIGGVVRLRVEIAATGEVSNVTIATSSRNRNLDRAASDAAMRWRFRPVRPAHEMHEAVAFYPITFTPP